jgi:hypothetical protein
MTNTETLPKLKALTFYQDGGHGWLKVPKKDLENLGIADKITRFSYMYGDHAYLEEDCDLATYLRALKIIDNGDSGERLKEFWERVRTQDSSMSRNGSRVRSYDGYEYHTEEDKKHIALICDRMLLMKRWNATTIKKLQKRHYSLTTVNYWKELYNIS